MGLIIKSMYLSAGISSGTTDSNVLTNCGMTQIFQVNYFSQAYISHELCKISRKIVFISSKFIALSVRTNIIDRIAYNPHLLAYGTTKLLNIIWCEYLRNQGYNCVSVHPGVVDTKLLSLFLRTYQTIFSRVIMTDESARTIIKTISREVSYANSYINPFESSSYNACRLVNESNIKYTQEWTIAKIKEYAER